MLAGCTVPKPMQVDSGAAPEYDDDKVRFRTTYYFRVVSLCGEGINPNNSNLIETDSLYRFRMTGKAGELANKIHFESGILHKNIIDPFGTVIRYDEDTGSAYVASHDEIMRESKRKMLLSEIDEYLKFLESDKIKNDDIKKPFLELIQNNIQNIKKLDSPQQGLGINPVPTPTPKNTKTSVLTETIKNDCDVGKRKAFQILGPQGMATYDQDQRLILSMSTNAKPLVSMLKELAARMMPRQTNAIENQLLIVNERSRLKDTESIMINLESKLDKTYNEKITPITMINEILKVFEEIKK